MKDHATHKQKASTTTNHNHNNITNMSPHEKEDRVDDETSDVPAAAEASSAPAATKTNPEEPDISRESLWGHALHLPLKGVTKKNPTIQVQVTGLEHAADPQDTHTAFARAISVDSNSKNAKASTTTTTMSEATVRAVVETVVNAGWDHVVHDILEHRAHIEVGAYPDATHLLQLGAVWLVNETTYTHHQGSHAHRLTPDEAETVPDWTDFTLRVHFVPDRFYAAHQVDWTKHTKQLLLGPTVHAMIGSEVPHLPVLTDGMPDVLDGVLVYENPELGYAIVNKPGSMPVHATLSNHTEDVVSMYRAGVETRQKKHSATQEQHKKPFVAISQNVSATLDTYTSGLLVVCTSEPYFAYYNHLFDRKKESTEPRVKKTFKCLVCVKKGPDSMGVLEHFASSGKLVTHYVDHKSATPKRFLRNKPQNDKKKNGGKNNHSHEWQECQMRILQVGDDKFRAAGVTSRYKKSADVTLSHLLWGPHPPTDVEYVMELQLEIVGTMRAHQIRGQLAALGFPIVGDVDYGGGKSELHSHKHFWNRIALQCCKLELPEPKLVVAGAKKKKHLEVSDKLCVFSMDEAWWSDYVRGYEMVHEALFD